MVKTREELIIRAVVEDRASKAFNKIGREVYGLEREVNTGLGKIEGKANDLGKTVGVLTKRFAALAAGFSAAAAIRSGVADAIQFSKALAEVSTISDVTSAQLQGLEEEVLALASAHGQSSVEITRGLYQTISAGVTDASDALKVLTASQELATAGLASTAATVDLLTSTINAYGLEIEDAGRISDTFFTGVRLGKTTIGELASSLGQVLPIAASLKVPLEDVVGLVAAITARGVSTSEAVTQVRAALVALLKRSEDVDEVLRSVGSGFDDTTLRSRGLVDVLQEVREALGGSESALTQLFGRVEATSAVLNVTGANLQGVKETLDSVRESAGATAEALGKIQAADGSRASKAFNNIRLRLQGLGSFLLELPFEVADAVGASIGELDIALQGLTEFQLPGADMRAYAEETRKARDEMTALRDARQELNDASGKSLAEGFNLERILFDGGGGRQRSSVAIRFDLEDLPGGALGQVLEGEDIRINVPLGFEAADFADVATAAREVGNTLKEDGRLTAQIFADSLTARLQGNRLGIVVADQVDPVVTRLENGLEKTLVGFTASVRDGVLTLGPQIAQTTEAQRNPPEAFKPTGARGISLASSDGANLRLQEITANTARQLAVIEDLSEQSLNALKAQRTGAAAAIDTLGANIQGTYEREQVALQKSVSLIQTKIAQEFRSGEISKGAAEVQLQDLEAIRRAILENIEAKRAENDERERARDLTEQTRAAEEARRRTLDGENFGGGFGIGIGDQKENNSGGRIGARAGAELYLGVEDSLTGFTNALIAGDNALEVFGDGILDVLQQILVQTAVSFATRGIFGGAQGGEVPRFYAAGGFGSSRPDPRDTVPALLREGEFVLRPETTRRMPSGSLQRLNNTGDFGAFSREIGAGGAASLQVGGGGGAVNQTVNLGGITISGGGTGASGGDVNQAKLLRDLELAIERGIRGANQSLVSAVRQAAGRRPA